MCIKNPGIDQQIIKKSPRESHIIHGRDRDCFLLTSVALMRDGYAR